LQII